MSGLQSRFTPECASDAQTGSGPSQGRWSLTLGARTVLTQGPPQDLADHRFWQLRAERDVRRHCVGGELLLAEGPEEGFISRLARAQNYPGLDGFSLQVVHDTGHANFRNGRMGRQHFF